MKNVSNKKASNLKKFNALKVKSTDKIKGGFIIIEDLSEG